MSYSFNFLICIVGIILQTTMFPHLPVLNHFYDLTIPFVVYLGIYRPGHNVARCERTSRMVRGHELMAVGASQDGTLTAYRF